MLVAEAEHHGTIESDERRMIAGVMRLGDRAVRAVMTPRTESTGSTSTGTRRRRARLLMETQHSRLPVGEGGVDAMIGVDPDARHPGRRCSPGRPSTCASMSARRRSSTTRPTRSTC